MQIIPSGLAPDNRSLASALARGCTTPGEEAALALLLRIPGALWAREDIQDAAYVQISPVPPTVTRVLWAVLPDHPPLSGAERVVVRICAMLALTARLMPHLDGELQHTARLALQHVAYLGTPDTRPEGDGTEPVPDGDDAELRRELHGLLGDLGRRARAARQQADDREDGAR